ncbi:ATPase [Sediminibacterium roseum]|uniref:ATPase n=1 Tax=Sediminibacterium roseum TaxID=1978412 RepID=A0ABW9ZSI8_9BACT|nr:SRPBCC family protein [Sediminibacterium roseum]NCI50087.1 ATPase [Sediminibacterium roseum]
METPNILQTTPECEIVTTRTFDAPRGLVFKAWTDPVHLSNWWGPRGFTNTFHTFDLRVGGRWIFTMHGPEKGNYENACTFIAVKEPELLVWDRQSQPIFQVEVRFEETAANQTKVVFKMKFNSEKECSKIRPFAPEKNEENMDKLEEELKKM